MPRVDYRLPQWFCVHTKPAHEPQAAASLKKLMPAARENVGEIGIYYPRMRTEMMVAGRPQKVQRPLFPRYFFARFIWEKAHRFVASRPQVIGVVRFGSMPTIVPSEVIDDLMAWSLERDEEIFDPTVRLSPGQRVLIQSGPFKGMEAEFISHLSDQKRVTLLLDHLYSHARLVMERSHLKPVG